MKKTSTLFALLALAFSFGVSPDAMADRGPDAFFDFQSDALHAVGSTLTDPAGFIINETFTVEGVSLQLVGGSISSRLYKDAGKGTTLVQYKEYATMTFVAPEGKAIESIEFSAFDDNIQSEVDGEAFEGTSWSGNAKGVRFTVTKTPYIYFAAVFLKDADGDTEELTPLNYVEVNNLREFNALEPGTYAKLNLNNAEVVGVSADGSSTVFIQDEAGGAWIQYSSLNGKLEAGDVFNGTIYTVLRSNAGNAILKDTEDTPKSEIEIVSDDDIAADECETAADLLAHKGKLISISGVDFKATSSSAGVLTVGDTTCQTSLLARSLRMLFSRVS